MKTKNIFIIFILVLFISCFPYVYYDQDEVLLKGVDIDQTIEIAKIELEEGGFDSILTLWAVRDQLINAEQAEKINSLYFQYIDKLEGDFEIWHYAWAISNLYRNNNDEVKAVLQNAYNDAKKRPEQLKQFKKIAEEHINGTKIYMGDVHDLGRAYARSHIVVSGNKDYIQSLEEFKEKKLKEKSSKK
ncbi:MAG: hypothetical protein JXB50_04330 [Spirochaetes bacterium]|nr:hypothetical protein [Spirochaetota bacterium]